MDDSLIDAMERAVAAQPDDVSLRMHLAGLLLDAGRGEEAVVHLARVLQQDPGSLPARELMTRAVAPSVPGATPAVPDAPRTDEPGEPDETSRRATPAGEFDWGAAEAEVDDLVPPMFVDGSDGEEPSVDAFDVEPSDVVLADVGGMHDVKERLEVAFLAPMRNPELRKLYGKSLRGGLLLYGPPGCGKTYIARAVAGELGAGFLHVGLSDVLDMWIGASERNLHDIFEIARRRAPCVVFLDEIDALGQKRSQLRNNAMRTTVNQLLSELDGAGSQNEGVFVLAATNHPWDVDVALRRPGRLDRTVLVLPPDPAAREAVLRTHLKDRPVAGIDLGKLAKRTDGFSGADLAHLCETAAERALMDSARTGNLRMIDMSDFDAALTQVKPSTGLWFESARNVALFANASGEYDDLLTYLKKRRLV